jgi:hypothetical protein
MASHAFIGMEVLFGRIAEIAMAGGETHQKSAHCIGIGMRVATRLCRALDRTGCAGYDKEDLEGPILENRSVHTFGNRRADRGRLAGFRVTPLSFRGNRGKASSGGFA